ncbi:MAG: hypothetical protein VYC34_06340, partial [Planctomycetota bacterium]|nr:hypothetical protein [Planctomycetota bacterium]
MRRDHDKSANSRPRRLLLIAPDSEAPSLRADLAAGGAEILAALPPDDLEAIRAFTAKVRVDLAVAATDDAPESAESLREVLPADLPLRTLPTPAALLRAADHPASP